MYVCFKSVSLVNLCSQLHLKCQGSAFKSLYYKLDKLRQTYMLAALITKEADY